MMGPFRTMVSVSCCSWATETTVVGSADLWQVSRTLREHLHDWPPFEELLLTLYTYCFFDWLLLEGVWLFGEIELDSVFGDMLTDNIENLS
jgi:hypothetical protein